LGGREKFSGARERSAAEFQPEGYVTIDEEGARARACGEVEVEAPLSTTTITTTTPTQGPLGHPTATAALSAPAGGHLDCAGSSTSYYLID
jgi:hypothetical protein